MRTLVYCVCLLVCVTSFFRRSAPLTIPGLITSPALARLGIKQDRHVYPGDYVVSEAYGVGQYMGLRKVELTPASSSFATSKAVFATVALVRFKDAVLSWYQQYAKEELWYMRASSVEPLKLSAVALPSSWARTIDAAKKSSRKSALNYCFMLAVRNNIHRTPYLQDSPEYRAFEESFSYTPTTDQLQCFRDIEADMANSTRPMDRLVCGDVGFGKTEVAIRAIYRASSSGRQVALLAPTKILAAQHKRTLEARMPGVKIGLLLGGGGKEGADTKEALTTGECQVIIGTHALLAPGVVFKNLGLLVIDEEQRFGVDHKEKLKASRRNTDVLTLSATPIPRTLQLSLAGLRDLSLMNSPPEGRVAVSTEVFRYNETLVRRAIEREMQRGGQVFVVCPRIAQVEKEMSTLQRLMPEVRFVAAHGKLPNLLGIIEAFGERQFDVLVATTVIENGIDMPNVNTIIVNYSEMFGMGQLYQLRGRVGRSDRQAYAYFLTRNDSAITPEAEERLEHLRIFNAPGSGYDLSRKDMEMRGFGTLFGTEQSGAKEVGMDLQSDILARQVEQLKRELVLPSAETRIALKTRLEKDGEALLGEPLPPPHDLMAVSRWEAALAKAILEKWKGDKSFQFLGPLLSASSTSVLQELTKKWREEHSNEGRLPVLVAELLVRAHARTLCRRAGITQVRPAPPDCPLGTGVVALECTMPNVTAYKWTEILQAAVPSDMRVSFAERSGDGFLYVATTTTTSTTTTSGNLKTIPTELLKLVRPLVAAVEEKMLAMDGLSPLPPSGPSG